MKKKMSILAVLLLAVVMTTYSVSGTYAKYTTSKTTSDSARVAKWGIGITNTVDLFADSYVGTEGGNDVVAADGTNVVAPGTSGSYTFELTGAPETNYTLDVVVTGEDKTGRLVFTLDGTDVGTIANLNTEIEKLYNTGKVYAAKTTTESEHTIGWYWSIENYESTADQTTKDAEDKTDTDLGDGALNADANAVTLQVSITATQSELDATI